MEMVSICEGRSGEMRRGDPSLLENGVINSNKRVLILKNPTESTVFGNVEFAPHHSVCRTNNGMLT